MAASGKKLLESKDNIDDVMPYDIWKLPKPIVNIVAGYVWNTPLQKPFLFSDVNYTIEKILFLIEHAGPLDEFKSSVTRCIKKELAKSEEKNSLIDKSFTLAGMQGTPVQLLISSLDVTIRNKEDKEIDKGMAESLIDIVAELCPHRLKEVQEQAQMAAPIEDEKTKEERESTNLAAINQVFNAIKQNNEKVTKLAIETFKEFVNNKKSSLVNNKGYLIDNRYYIDRIHLIYGAVDILAQRGGELPPVGAEDFGRWYGKKADRFCFEIIGATLQLDLPPRPRQILRSGLYYLLNHNQKTERSIDVSGDLFRGVGTAYLLGGNSYYDDIGRCGPPVDPVWRAACPRLRRRASLGGVFKTYCEQLQQHTKHVPQSVSEPKEKTHRYLIM